MTEPEFSVKLIRLADGSLIDPLTRTPVNSRPAPAQVATEPEEPEEESDEPVQLNLVPLTRRSVMDLSLTPSQMAVINNVLVYTIWGLPDDEIAMQCNCTTQQVRSVRDLDDYKRMYDALIEGLRNAYTSTVQGIFAEAAPRAAVGVVRKMRHKSADIALAAKKDILDRAGFRPADKVEHNHSFGNGSELVIRIIKQSDADNLPTLDLSANA